MGEPQQPSRRTFDGWDVVAWFVLTLAIAEALGLVVPNPGDLPQLWGILLVGILGGGALVQTGEDQLHRFKDRRYKRALQREASQRTGYVVRTTKP